jgi:hypothetical protein
MIPETSSARAGACTHDTEDVPIHRTDVGNTIADPSM